MPKIRDIPGVILDPEDYEIYKDITGNITNGYVSIKNRGLHRILMNLSDKKLVVDHINHNKLDNRRCNLRVCTQSQNNMNRRSFKNNELGIKGVRKRKDNRKSRPYSATIKLSGKDKHLGYFATIEEAVEARLAAVKKYFGDYGAT